MTILIMLPAVIITMVAAGAAHLCGYPPWAGAIAGLGIFYLGYRTEDKTIKLDRFAMRAIRRSYWMTLAALEGVSHIRDDLMHTRGDIDVVRYLADRILMPVLEHYTPHQGGFMLQLRNDDQSGVDWRRAITRIRRSHGPGLIRKASPALQETVHQVFKLHQVTSSPGDYRQDFLAWTGRLGMRRYGEQLWPEGVEFHEENGSGDLSEMAA